jgi:fumarylpyruvate hydrolase
MSSYLFDPPAVVTVPVEGRAETFPVRRILCVGRNYAAHRREMGGDDRDPPFFFAKPADAIVVCAPSGGASRSEGDRIAAGDPAGGGDVAYPPKTANLHHEIELVVALKAGGKDVPVDKALDLVLGYAVGVDMTRRDLQNAAKDKGQPWDASKGFDASAPISAIKPWTGAPPQGRIRLSVNGESRQDATVADMIWATAEIISEASKLWTLAPGDLIYTGTPEGVGPLVRGDRVEGEVEGVGSLAFKVV